MASKQSLNLFLINSRSKHAFTTRCWLAGLHVEGLISARKPWFSPRVVRTVLRKMVPQGRRLAICPPPCVWFVTQLISRNHLAQGPFVYHGNTHDCVTKEPLQAAYRIIHKAIHQGQSILQSSMVAYWILSGIDPGTKSTTSTTTKVPVPFWDRYPGSGPQFVVAERVFRRDPREDVIRWRRVMEAYSSMAKSQGYMEETLNLSMTAKQAPSYDGKVSWLRYEELVDDWVTITTIKHPREDLCSRAD